MIAVAQWLRMQVLSMEVPGVQTLVSFSTFCVPFLPCGDCSIRVYKSSFCFITLQLYCNSIY